MWQRRRLEKMQQANFSCEVCGDDSEELHVHHQQYLNGWEPWDYPNSMLMCLCKTCHDIMHMDQDKVRKHCVRLAVVPRHVPYYERLVCVPHRRQLAFESFDADTKAKFVALRHEACVRVVQLRDELRQCVENIFGELNKRRGA
jgi:hypothetical protein